MYKPLQLLPLEQQLHFRLKISSMKALCILSDIFEAGFWMFALPLRGWQP
jgi:hypothetical protein